MSSKKHTKMEGQESQSRAGAAVTHGEHAGSPAQISMQSTGAQATAAPQAQALGAHAQAAATSPGHPEAGRAARGMIRWRAILAGLLTALATMIVLGLVGAALGMAMIDAPRYAQAQGHALLMSAATWTAITAILASFAGGLVAGRMSGARDMGRGALHGVLAVLLVIPLTLLLAMVGLASIFGALGQLLTAPLVAPISGSLLVALLALGAAALGGALGARRVIRRRG